VAGACVMERVLTIRHLGLKLCVAIVLDLAALTILRSERVRAWCETLDGALADTGGDE
jgi:hypothetical protein